MLTLKQRLLRMGVSASYYPTLLFNRTMAALRIWRHWDWIDDHVLVGAVPSRKDLERLRELGVGAIVNMCEEFCGHIPQLAAHGIVQLHLPTLDYHSPTAEAITQGVEFIRDQVRQGRKVLIHCKAGRGRSATLAMCYLIAQHGMTAEEAYRQIKKARPHIDTRIQYRAVIREFELGLRPRMQPAPEPQRVEPGLAARTRHDGPCDPKGRPWGSGRLWRS